MSIYPDTRFVRVRSGNLWHRRGCPTVARSTTAVGWIWPDRQQDELVLSDPELLAYIENQAPWLRSCDRCQPNLFLLGFEVEP